MQIRAACLAVLATMAAAAPAVAGNIPVYNTGVDASGTPLASGEFDAHYTLVPGGAPRVARDGTGPVGPGGWLPDEDGLSAWIGPNTDAIFDTGPMALDFRTSFTLTGSQAATASITGRLAVDDWMYDILINGQSIGGVSGIGTFTDWTSFTISSGFVGGLNTIDFIAWNTGGPGGFRAEMTGTYDGPVPEPASWALMLGGFGLVGGSLRARRRAIVHFA